MKRNTLPPCKLIKSSAKAKANPSESHFMCVLVRRLPKFKLPLTQRELSFLQASVAKLYLYCGAKGSEYAELLAEQMIKHKERRDMFCDK